MQTDIETVSYNSFAPNGVVQHSEDVFVLSSSQLQGIIEKAVNEATEPLWKMYENMEFERALLAQRVRALEHPKAKEVKDSPLIDELYNHMKSVGLKQTTFAGAAKILKVTKGRVVQLKNTIALDQRFILLPSGTHKQRLLIRLREVTNF
jgi:hypothetical protein